MTRVFSRAACMFALGFGRTEDGMSRPGIMSLVLIRQFMGKMSLTSS